MIDIALTFCTRDACLIGQGGVPLYRNDGRLSAVDARLAETGLKDVFEQAK